MGLSRDSVGIKSVDCGLEIRKRQEDDKVIALAAPHGAAYLIPHHLLQGM